VTWDRAAPGSFFFPLAWEEAAEPEPLSRSQQKLIALSFDDFPFPQGTPKLLEVLATEKVRVTFFTIGRKLEKHPEFAAQALYHGHALENHTYDHVRLTTRPLGEVRADLRRCNVVIRDLTGVAPHYLRSPGGRSTPAIRREAAACGLLCVDPLVANIGDMNKSSATITQRCQNRARDGVIFSLHDGVPATMAALPKVIHTLRGQGYEFVTVHELLQAEGS